MEKTRKYLIIRNDDIEVDMDLSLLKSMSDILSIYPQVFGVIPYSRNGKKIVFEEKEIFEFLKEKSLEYALHGVFHKRYLGEYEFSKYTIEQEKVYSYYLNKCYKYMFDIKTFIPPNNAIDNRWIPFLESYNINIISGTKREIENKYINNVQYSKTGVIKEGGVFMIPQSFMVKKREFLKEKEYFSNIFNKIQTYYKYNNLLVMTVHWWEFVGNKQEDKMFKKMYMNLLYKLKESGIEAISFQQALDKGESCYIRTDHFAL